MSGLNTEAKRQLEDAGITQVGWAREHYLDGKWHGDACGCPDDRCVGYHHDDNEECGCLQSLISDALRARARAALSTSGEVKP